MSNTLFIGKVYYRFDELPSTNDWATELLAKSTPPEGLAVRADTQTAGRGQFGSQWISPPRQNLLTSIILYPNWLPVQQQFYLSMAVALGLHDTVRSLLPPTVPHLPLALKWPNDLYFGNKKAAGILIQNSISGAALQSSVIGIGLNVNQISFDPALPNPTSMAVAFGMPFDLENVMETMFDCLEHRYLQLKSGHKSVVKTDYENALFRRGEVSAFKRLADHTTFQGIIRGVTDNGFLQLEMPEGDLVAFNLKEISFA